MVVVHGRLRCANCPYALFQSSWAKAANVKNWNFSASIISLTPSPTLPRCGLRPAGEGDFSIANRSIAHTLPDPRPLRASPCRGGGFFNCQLPLRIVVRLTVNFGGQQFGVEFGQVGAELGAGFGADVVAV